MKNFKENLKTGCRHSLEPSALAIFKKLTMALKTWKKLSAARPSPLNLVD